MLSKMISKNGLILAGFAVVSVGLISLTYFITRDTIAGEMKAALARTLDELVEKERYNNDVYHDCTLITDGEMLASSKALKAYRMRMHDQPVAIVLETIAPNGYSGNIAMVVAIDQDATIAGVRVTEHQETPGLGDKIELRKSDWILSFAGKSLKNPSLDNWAVKKDGGEFDAFTGATITPRAVIAQVAKTLAFFERHKDELFNNPQNCQ
ncbi:electron transport complex subunit RsxG [Kangiella sp. TOML190]|uniref:electron transport complex subunit RsxG n=1 Tax=Kangiella sp. TOML190 TaxID=2931351 RepID=UPI002041D22B|nr:electron transport complex subunit RsxG [Kangiella sp. TOML190]